MTEIVLAIVGGVFIVAGALIAYLGTRGKTKADAKAAADARIDMRINAELVRIYARLDAAELTIAGQAAQLSEAHRRLDDAEAAMGVANRQQIEMIQHIVGLEQLIPNPPGPPARPHWKLPILENGAS